MQLLNTETISRTNKRTIGSTTYSASCADCAKTCVSCGLREDLRFLRMLSISQGRRIDDIMEQFEPKPSALAKIARYSVAAALAVAALLVTIIGLAYGSL
jgi:hypothetical protein